MSDEADFQRVMQDVMDAAKKGEDPARAAEEGAPPPGGDVASQASAPPSPQPDPQRVPPINWDTEPTPAYVNGVQVVHSPQDFALLFTEMRAFPGRHSATGKVGDERASIAASIRMTPEVFFRMVCMLGSNWNRYVSEHVDPRMRQPRFKLIDAGEMQLDGIKRNPDE